MFKRITKTCVQCNNSYLGTKNSKYCGQNCSREARKKRVTVNCQHCNQDFEVQEWNKDAKYCSYDCKYKSQSSDVLTIICDNCKTPFERKEHLVGKGKHSFCSKICSNQFNIGSNHYEWKEHLHDKNIKLALKQWALKIKERDNYICQLCGEKDRDILEAHHIKHKSSFPELQFDFTNGITLCLDCHALQHINEPKALRLINYKIAAKRKGK
jgi:hypothetical protein